MTRSPRKNPARLFAMIKVWPLKRLKNHIFGLYFKKKDLFRATTMSPVLLDYFPRWLCCWHVPVNTSSLLTQSQPRHPEREIRARGATAVTPGVPGVTGLEHESVSASPLGLFAVRPHTLDNQQGGASKWMPGKGLQCFCRCFAKMSSGSGGSSKTSNSWK